MNSPSSHSPRTVALVGNPNCGKTTLFNALTGSRYKVANYPGVTVETKEGSLVLPDGSVVRILDLPGTYALEGSSIDEKLVSQVLTGQSGSSARPDLIIAVVDATNLQRNLFLVSELIDANYRLILAINMIDEAERAGIKIYDELLARALDVTVVTMSARSHRGLDTLCEAVASELRRETRSSKKCAWLSIEHLPKEMLTSGSFDARTLEAFREDPLNALASATPDTIARVGGLRYSWLRKIVERSTSNSLPSLGKGLSRLDRLLTSKAWGLPILLALFGLVFQAIFLWAQAPMELISTGVESVSAAISASLPPGMLTRLLAEGIVPGVGNVVVFVPQIAILFMCIGLLEDSGYLSRAAFLLDTMMRRIGLQGRAFIPLLSSFACAIPGILATRTIPSRADRLATIMIAPLMSCSARLPVYAVLIAAFIPATRVWGIVSLQGLVLLIMYLLGILGACAVAWLLKATLLRKESSFLVMEMPPLRLPVLTVVFRSVYDSVVSFLRNASTVILACSIIVWFLASYPKPGPDFSGNPVQASYAGQLGTALEPIIKPLGFNWEIGVGIISSFPAREVFVSTMATMYNISDSDEGHEGLIETLQARQADGSFSTLTAISLMVFYVFACQCMSTLAVCRRETGSWAWTAGMFVYMTALAYLASLATFQIGRIAW